VQCKKLESSGVGAGERAGEKQHGPRDLEKQGGGEGGRREKQWHAARYMVFSGSKEGGLGGRGVLESGTGCL